CTGRRRTDATGSRRRRKGEPRRARLVWRADCGNLRMSAERGSAATGGRSERVGVEFAGADAHNLVEVPDEDLAVADLAGTGGLHDRLDHGIGLLVGHRDLELDLGQEVDDVLGA